MPREFYSIFRRAEMDIFDDKELCEVMLSRGQEES